MISSRFRLILAAFLLSASLAQADILVLKNGDRKEGTVLNETPDAVRMKYRLTEKIWDEKDFPRADIAEVIRQRPEEVALAEQGLRKLVPTADMMSADEYERLIQDKLRPFVNQYPGTAEASEVEGMIQALQAEKQKVVSGQLKVDGEWLTAEQVKRDEFNINAYRERREIEELAAANDLAEWNNALKKWDRFIDPSTGSIASTHYPELIPGILDLLDRYESLLLKMISEQPILQKAREDNMKNLVEPDLSRTKAAIDRELGAWKATYDAEKRSRVKWLAPFKYDLKSLQEAHKIVVTERARLQGLDLATLADFNEKLVSVYRFLADENIVEAENALTAAATAIGTDSTYSRILSALRVKVNSLKADLARRKQAERTYNAASGALTSAGTGAIVDDRVAQAMAAIEAPKEEPPAEQPATAPAATPAPTPAPAAATPASAPVPPAASSGLPLMFVGGAVVLLIILIVAMMAQKKKKSAE